jgi:hypothetical protein
VYRILRSLAGARDDNAILDATGRERAASRARITTDPAISIGSPLFPYPHQQPENNVILSASEGSLYVISNLNSLFIIPNTHKFLKQFISTIHSQCINTLTTFMQ